MLFPLYSAGFTAALLHILNGGFNAPDTLFEKHTSFILLAFAFLFPVGPCYPFGEEIYCGNASHSLKNSLPYVH